MMKRAEVSVASAVREVHAYSRLHLCIFACLAIFSGRIFGRRHLYISSYPRHDNLSIVLRSIHTVSLASRRRLYGVGGASARANTVARLKRASNPLAIVIDIRRRRQKGAEGIVVAVVESLAPSLAQSLVAC